MHPLDIVFRLAEDHGIVLLNGGGFEAPDWSVRVSFANLDDDVYDDIGRAVRAVARSYVMAFQASQAAAARRRAVEAAGHESSRSSACFGITPRSRSSSSSGSVTCVGKVKLGSFTLGAVTGTLLAGVVVGQLGVQVSGEVKQCFFLLFLFSIGFRTGPQFFRGLKSDGLQQAALSAIVATTGPDRGLRRQPALRLRRRHRRGRHRRLAHRVGDDRHRERRHRAAGPVGGRRGRA